MSAPTFSAADFTVALQNFLPRGRVWSRDAGAVLTDLLTGLAQSYARNSGRANNAITEAFPSTTYELLPEWEETLGLPDPCAGEAPTVQGRRAQVLARFASRGGQSVAYMIQFAANLGYVITITQFTPARAGLLRAGDPLCGQAWAFAWQVNAPVNTITPFLAGAAVAGQALSSNGNGVLQCELERVKPAHTTVIFHYT